MPALADAASNAHESDGAARLRPGEAQALLRIGFERFLKKLVEMAAAALDASDDLFEATSHIPDGEIEAFRQQRPEWLARFATVQRDLFERRLAGHRRKGLRPDADASVGALRVLTPFDHEMQAALTHAARRLAGFTQRELAALDLRVGVLLAEGHAQELDNPFSTQYVLDALGSTSRAVYPAPRVWRPLMARLLTDLTPNFNGLYIALNRLLADHGVLPEIKATLRARSEHRPSDDRDLLATFTQMLRAAPQAIPGDIVVPEFAVTPGAPPALTFDRSPVPVAAAAVPTVADPPAPPHMVSADILAGLTALAALGAQSVAAASATSTAGGPDANGTAAADPANSANEFPSLDPLMALGTSTSLFSTLAQWQKVDLRTAIARLAPPPVDGVAGAVVPLNLIPHIRAAVATQISNPADAISVDVIGLLFDYIFRDPTIPESTRALFGRLQVPIVKAALLDRAFFADKKHPARQLLDHLADAAVGAGNDDAYRAAFEAAAQKAIDRICADFEIDVAVFRDADHDLVAFAEQERQKSAATLAADVAEALHAEEDEADRAVVRELLRDRLAGLDVPFDVRSFIETIWADYLAVLRREHGVDSPPWTAALVTLDDTLWSIAAKERSAQKARLSKMIPSLIGALRAGCTAMRAPAERSQAFFDALYQLHMAAIRPEATKPVVEATAAAADEAEAVETIPPLPPPPPVNVHDYVGEMAVGTWLRFDLDDGVIDARLNWVSPLRAKYIFTSRSRSHALMLSPEELAYRLGSGTARLVIEPVPLWDRAVSSALDTLAARRPPAPAGAATPACAPA
jgi:hypothetical protein